MDRALIRETLPTFLLATGVTTFLLVFNALFRLAELMVSRNVGKEMALRLMGLGIPHILALTIPIGVLFAVLMTSARWSADSELVAVQACGVRPGRVARPLVLLGTVFFLLNLANTWLVVPHTNQASQNLVRRLRLSVGVTMLQAREIAEDFQGYLLYVDRIDPVTGVWQGIVLFETSNPKEEQLILARSGRFAANPQDGSAVLSLQEVTTHLLDPDHPERYRQNTNRALDIYLRPQGPDPNQKLQWGPRETGSLELLARVRLSTATRSERVAGWIELHRRVAIPAAALLFVLVAFPLGAQNRRGGKGFGLTAAVLLVMLYYIVLMAGESLATSGRVPPLLGAWLPNLVLAGIAAATFGGVRRLGAPSQAALRVHGFTTMVAGWIKHLRASTPERRRPVPRDRTPRSHTAVSRLIAPGILDAYLLRMCLAFLVLVLLAVCTLWIAINLAENLDDIHRNQASLSVVVGYYAFSLPQIFREMLPLAFLIAFLGTTAVLERHNETTALKAAGVSLSRVVLPLLLLGASLAVGLFVLDDQITSRANRASQQLYNVIKGRKEARAHRATHQLWMFLPDGRTLVNFMQYDPDTFTLVRPSLFVFDQSMNLRTRYMARNASYTNGTWQAEQAWSRTFLPEGRIEFIPPMPRATELPLMVGQDYFGREYRKAAQMSYRELSSYIANLRSAGYRVDRLRVQLHLKLAYPLTMLLLPWLSVSFAFQFARRGAVMGIALAIVLGMLYFAVMAFSTRLGEASLVPPLIAAWTPTIVFALLAANRHTYLRT